MRCYKSPSHLLQCQAKRHNTQTHTHTHTHTHKHTHTQGGVGRGRRGSSQGEIAPCREVRAKETCARIEGGGGGVTGGHAANPEPHAHAQPHTNTHTQSTRTCTPLHKHRHHRYSQLAHFPYNNSGCMSMCSARAEHLIACVHVQR